MLIAASVLPPACAQIDRGIAGILDRCAKTFKSAGGIKARFAAAQFNGRDAAGSSEGTIFISGEKVFIDSEDVKTWFDGKTQWVYSRGSNEVDVSEPTAEERARMNPYSFLSIYKKGYAATMTSETVRGESCHSISLKAEDRAADMPVILLTISKKTMLPVCIRTRIGRDNWTRISIYGLEKHRRFKDGIFRFDKRGFPDAEVVDLR